MMEWRPRANHVSNDRWGMVSVLQCLGQGRWCCWGTGRAATVLGIEGAAVEIGFGVPECGGERAGIRFCWAWPIWTTERRDEGRKPLTYEEERNFFLDRRDWKCQRRR